MADITQVGIESVIQEVIKDQLIPAIKALRVLTSSSLIEAKGTIDYLNGISRDFNGTAVTLRTKRMLLATKLAERLVTQGYTLATEDWTEDWTEEYPTKDASTGTPMQDAATAMSLGLLREMVVLMRENNELLKDLMEALS